VKASLLARAIAQFLVFLILLGGIVLGAAGTIAWWNGWLWLATFGGASMAITMYLYRRDPALLERRLALAETGEPSAAQRAMQAIAGLAFVALMVLAGLDRRWLLTDVPDAIAIAACAVELGGFAIVLEVFRENTYASSVVAVERDQRVIDTGLYARVRHPMYTGGFLVIFASPLVLGSLVALAACPILTLAIVVRARDEERVLAAELPGYADYLRRVRYRFIPGVA
jgi:protein-S-isoprenylcysteine O-methyltransferase Ste14